MAIAVCFFWRVRDVHENGPTSRIPHVLRFCLMEIMIKHKRISGDHILGQRQVSDSVMFGSKKCSDVLIILDDQTPIVG